MSELKEAAEQKGIGQRNIPFPYHQLDDPSHSATDELHVVAPCFAILVLQLAQLQTPMDYISRHQCKRNKTRTVDFDISF